AISVLDKVTGENLDQTTGVKIVQKALEEPLKQIVNNAGLEGSVVLQKVKEGKDDFGFNAFSEKYENLIKAGVLDPTKVTRTALENAASVSALLITTEAVVYEKKEKEPPMPAMPHGGGMGDMY
ncbi:MAG TPA: TCP-1/cpn60 chaperonin family protein, partial [Ignavibacteriaceae bacterium]